MNAQCNVFLAIFPDPLTAQCIAKFANTVCQKHGLHGSVRPASHLHVSVPVLNLEMAVPEKVVDQVCETVTSVTRRFEINFDQVKSFRGSPENRPLVLANDNSVDNGVMRFHGSLCAEFAKYASPTYSIPKFTPHVTVLYDKQELAPEPIETMFWTVKEIVLVLSEVGATKYHRLRSWVLGK